MSEEVDASGGDDPKQMIKDRIVNIGDLLETTKSGEGEDQGETFETDPSDRSFETEHQQQQPKKSWNERISRMFSRVSAVGLAEPKKQEYITETEEVMNIMCEFFDAEANLPLVIKEIKAGELTPKEAMMYLGFCMIAYLLMIRINLLEKISEKLKLKDKKDKGDETKK